MEEKFIEYMKNKSLSENTYNSYISDIKIFKKYYIDSYGEELSTLIHGDVKMYCNYLIRNNYAAKTVNRKLAALKEYNLFLIDNGIQENIAVLDRDYIKIQNKYVQKELPTEQYMNKIKHAAITAKRNSKRDYCIIVVFSCAGLRASEMVNLRLVDVNLNERFISVIGKGNKYRKVVINNSMYDALSDYLEERNAIKTENPYFFIGQKNIKNKKPMLRSVCNRILDTYKPERVNFRLYPHLLRSLFCTNAIHIAGYTMDQLADQARSFQFEHN